MDGETVCDHPIIGTEPPLDLSYGSHDVNWKPPLPLDDKSLNSTATSASVLTKNKPFPVRGERANYINTPHVVVMVGLPARGKTYMAKKLTRYLNWIGIKTKVFNVGEYRRRATKLYSNHNFFRPDNEEAMLLRELCALDALKDVCKWLEEENGEVAVFDATNTTIDRRLLIYNIVVGKMQYKLFYVESICDKQDIIESNIREVKLSSPDYVGMNSEEAIKDFVQRIDHYKDIYHPLDEEKEDHLSFIKVFNTGEKVVVHMHEGHIQARIVYYLMNIQVTRKNIYLTSNNISVVPFIKKIKIFFTQAGESENDVAGKIGGNSSLSERGKEYGKALGEYIKQQNIPKLRVWTSWMKRTLEMAKYIEAPQERWKCLNELDLGVCEELTYKMMEEKYPEEVEERFENKFSYRFPRGESYEDLVARLEPVIMELERQENVLIIAHQAVLRCLLGYYLDESSDKLPYIKVPPHTVMKLMPVAYGCEVEYIPLNVPAVNTYQPRPVDFKMSRNASICSENSGAAECNVKNGTNGEE